MGERLIISMLADVHKATNTANDGLDPDFVMSALAGGHYWALGWEYPGLIHSHTDKEANLNEVVDFLDMWSFIEEAAEGFTKDQKAALPWTATFVGFDGNNETEHLGIARFLIEKMDRFQRFKGRSLNSHHPVLARYRRMVDTFEPIRRNLVGRSMSVTELEAVLGTR